MIYTCAVNFNKLLGITYDFQLAKKGKVYPIHLEFSEDQFHHLAGLQYLSDRYQLTRMNREIIFRNILDKKITIETLRSSKYFSKIEQRIQVLCELESLLDGCNLIFKYDQPHFSKIKADFLFQGCIATGTETCVFTLKNRLDDSYFCTSIFPKTDKDYSNGRTPLTILSRVKTEKLTGRVLDEYIRPGAIKTY